MGILPELFDVCIISRSGAHADGRRAKGTTPLAESLLLEAFDPNEARDAAGRWHADSAVSKLKAMEATHPDEWTGGYAEIDRHVDTLAKLTHAEIKAAARHLWGEHTVVARFSSKAETIRQIRNRFRELLGTVERNRFRESLCRIVSDENDVRTLLEAWDATLLEHATAHKPAGTPEGGQFTSDGNSEHPGHVHQLVQAAHATHDYLHSKAAQGFAKLPSPVQKVVSTALAVAFTGWTASQKIAERISIEKGSTPEQAAQLRSTLAAWDMVAFKPMAFATAPLGGAVAAASWIVPPVTGVYLAHAAVRHPLATYRAARGIIKDAVAATKKVVADHTQKL